MTNESKMVFIAGHMRSGTSMVRTLLGSHSELALHENDLQLWTRLYGRFELRWGREPAGAIAVELARAVFGDQKFEYLAHQVDAESFEQKLLKDDLDSLPSYAALAAHVFGRYLDAYRELRGRVRTGCKTPENEFFARHILDNFPQGKMIQVYRNVAGVAGSFKKKGTLELVFPLGLVELGFLWSKSLECGYENMLHYPGRYFMLSYDHMVYEPELYTRLLCGFLDMQYEPAMLALDNHIDPDILKGSSSYGMDGSARIDPQIAHKPVQVLEQRELDTLRLATYAAFDAARRFHGGYDPDTLGLLCLDRMVAMFKDEGRDELVSIALELMKSWSKTMRRHPAVPRS